MDILLDYIYQLNWVAVLVAASVGVLINAVWYSDKLFGKVWRKATHLKKKDIQKPEVNITLAIVLLTVFISSAATAVLVDVLRVNGALNGLLFGLLIGFGFMLTNNGMHKLYEQRPFALFAITAVGDLLTMAAIGVILAIV